MSEQTNEEVVQALIAHVEADCDGGETTHSAMTRKCLAAVLARMSPGWQPIATAPKDGRLIRIARHMGEPWGWVLGTARWVGSGLVSGWVARGVGGPADGLGLAAPTHWAEFTPPTPATEAEKP